MSINRRSIRGLCLAACLTLSTVLTWSSPAFPATVKVSDLTCESCLLIDMSTGDPLFERASDTPLPNASTTKMATALVVADEAPFRELVRVSSTAAAVGGGGLDLSEGDVASVRDLLYALLLDSSNEAAVALAEHVSGDVGDFVRRMNRMVRDLGATDTRFVNPHGLDQAGHVSTAADLAVIGQRVLATPRLATIVASPVASISVNGGTRAVENRNVLLEGYTGAVGIKTGRTLGAGEVLVAAARRGPHGVLAVAMRSADAAADARRLLDAGFAELRARSRREKRAAERAAANPEVLLNERQSVGALVFDPAGATEVIAGEEVTGALPDGVVAAEYRFTPSERLLLPLTEGEEIGSVEVIAGDVVVATVPALAQDAIMIEESSWAERAFSGILRTAALVMGGLGA